MVLDLVTDQSIFRYEPISPTVRMKEPMSPTIRKPKPKKVISPKANSGNLPVDFSNSQMHELSNYVMPVPYSMSPFPTETRKCLSPLLPLPLEQGIIVIR